MPFAGTPSVIVSTISSGVPPWIQVLSTRLGPMPPSVGAMAADAVGLVDLLARLDRPSVTRDRRRLARPRATASRLRPSRAASAFTVRALRDEVVVHHVAERPEDREPKNSPSHQSGSGLSYSSMPSFSAGVAEHPVLRVLAHCSPPS